MKKLLLLFLALMLLLCACAPQTDSNFQTQSSNISEENPSDDSSTISDKSYSVSETKDEKPTNIYVTYNNSGHYLPGEYEYPVKSVLYSGVWSEETAECLYDFTLRFENKVFEYSSSCGTLVLNGKSKQLNDYDRENLNDLLFSLFGIE